MNRAIDIIEKIEKAGTPKQDGSGGGIRKNKGRGGCSKAEQDKKQKEELDNDDE